MRERKFPVSPLHYLNQQHKMTLVQVTKSKMLLAAEIWCLESHSSPAGQPKMTCPSTIISPPNKDQSGGNTMSSSSILPPPSTSYHRTTHSPSHRLSSFQAITSKPTKITSQCAPTKELSDLCLSESNRICIDNQQDKVTWQLMLWTWGLACNSRSFS